MYIKVTNVLQQNIAKTDWQNPRKMGIRHAKENLKLWWDMDKHKISVKNTLQTRYIHKSHCRKVLLTQAISSI